ncbi:MAG: thiamine kinase-like enzyme [Bacteroidia bacterium]|jgi:thiamine kinase-like enzyme
MNSDFRNYLLNVTNSSSCEEVEIIQSLWSGYGEISRLKLQGSSPGTVVVKHISLKKGNEHPRGWNTDISHNRKIRSYEVETQWYHLWNHLCKESSRTAKFIGSFTLGLEQWIILEDLDNQFPDRKHELTLKEVKTCLQWLANFHGTFINREPEGLWEVGTYWHLDTRPEEFEKIQHEELKLKARQIDELLTGCTYQTIVHGDAKLANFCFSKSGEKVAVVDFQYVGRGCGMKDVAYFLGSCLSSDACEDHSEALLDFYFLELKKAIGDSAIEIDFKALEQEWRSMFPIAWTDFTRFLLGWMPSHQKVNSYSLKVMQSVLVNL